MFQMSIQSASSYQDRCSSCRWSLHPVHVPVHQWRMSPCLYPDVSVQIQSSFLKTQEGWKRGDAAYQSTMSVYYCTQTSLLLLLYHWLAEPAVIYIVCIITWNIRSYSSSLLYSICVHIRRLAWFKLHGNLPGHLSSRDAQMSSLDHNNRRRYLKQLQSIQSRSPVQWCLQRWKMLSYILWCLQARRKHNHVSIQEGSPVNVPDANPVCLLLPR